MSAPFFDTNILVDWLFGRPQAKTELLRYPKHRVSRVVWAELLAGEPPERRLMVQAALLPLEVVEVDQRIASAAADLQFRMRMKMMDALILATAQVNGAILITRNTEDFPAQMPGIRVPYTL